MVVSASLGGGENRTLEPISVEWSHGDVRERITIPAGETTDFSSIPTTGVLGWLARRLGFDKNAPYFQRAGAIHDALYWALKYRGGVLPLTWYWFYNEKTQAWEHPVFYRWERQQADAIWRRIVIEDGGPPRLANIGYRVLRAVGGLHMLLT